MRKVPLRYWTIIILSSILCSNLIPACSITYFTFMYYMLKTGNKYSFFFFFRFLMVFMCLSLSVISTIEDHEYEDEIEEILFHLEIVIVVWFGIEFLIRYGLERNVKKIFNRAFTKSTCINRLWSSGCRSRYQGCIGRLRFMRSPFCIIGKWIFDCPFSNI